MLARKHARTHSRRGSRRASPLFMRRRSNEMRVASPGRVSVMETPRHGCEAGAWLCVLGASHSFLACRRHVACPFPRCASRSMCVVRQETAVLRRFVCWVSFVRCSCVLDLRGAACASCVRCVPACAACSLQAIQPVLPHLHAITRFQSIFKFSFISPGLFLHPAWL